VGYILKNRYLKSIEIVRDSLLYPFNKKSYLGLLVLLSTTFLIIPGILALGYLFSIIYFAIDGEEEHPGLNDWMNMFLDGLIFLGIALMFGIVFYGLLWILETFLIGDVDLNLSSFIIAIIYTSLFNALFVMSLAHMVDEKIFTAAFEFKKIFGLIKELGWIKYLTLIVFMTLFGGLIHLLIELVSPALDLPGLGSFPGIVVLTLLTYTYLFSFESRLTGLIYPKN
jgi:hypothetical protein